MPVLQEIAHVSDVPVDINVELDRKRMSMRQLLELDIGSVIKMSRSAGENIDIVIGGMIVGFGEIVIIEDTVGVRITDFSGEE